MATPNVVTKESHGTQQTSYGPRAVKTDDDAEGHVGLVLAHSERATVRGLRRRTIIPRVMSGEAKS